MKVVPYLKLVCSLSGGLLLWRLLDWPQIIWPNTYISYVSAFFISFFIIWLPINSFYKKFTFKYFPAVLFVLCIFAYFSSPLSDKATLEPEQSHCGSLTYTGTFYSSKNFFLDAYRDDFEARNQLCWLRKMIQKVPAQIDENELVAHLSILKSKLLKPEYKYRSSLPLIAILHGKYLMNGPSSRVASALKAKDLYFEISFWKEQYSEHIGTREYSWPNWPFSSLVKSEFHFIEENWNNIHISITQSPP